MTITQYKLKSFKFSKSLSKIKYVFFFFFLKKSLMKQSKISDKHIIEIIGAICEIFLAFYRHLCMSNQLNSY